MVAARKVSGGVGLSVPRVLWLRVGEGLALVAQICLSSRSSSPFRSKRLVRGVLVGPRVLSVALDLSLPEGCPFFDLSSRVRIQLDGCIRSHWTAKEAVISSAASPRTAGGLYFLAYFGLWLGFFSWVSSGFFLEAIGTVAIRV
ncbi:hypothetical protein Bca101_018610 [Brassica carinata]